MKSAARASSLGVRTRGRRRPALAWALCGAPSRGAGGQHHRAARDRKAPRQLHTHHREHRHARNQAYGPSPARRRGSRRNGPNLRATGLATTAAVAGILGGALLVAHTPANASTGTGTAASLATMPKTNLSAYSTAVSRAV